MPWPTRPGHTLVYEMLPQMMNRLVRRSLGVAGTTGFVVSAGCGASSLAPVTTHTAQSLPTPQPTVRITAPRGNARVKTGPLTIQGTITPANGAARVEVTRINGRTMRRTVRGQGGRWAVTFRRPPRGDVAVFVVTGPPDLDTDDSFDTVTIRVGPPPETRSARRTRYLVRRQAIGKTTSAIRVAIGKPFHTQQIGGRTIWYYNHHSNMYQLLIADSRVIDINKY